MSETIETVVVFTDAGPVTINKSDLKPEHKLSAENAEPAAKPQKRNRTSK
jgi:hypothetical protein